MPARAHIRVAIRTRPTAAFDQDEIFIDPVNKVSICDVVYCFLFYFYPLFHYFL